MAEEASSVSRIMVQVMTILASLGIKWSGFDHFPVMVVFFFFGLGVGGGEGSLPLECLPCILLGGEYTGSGEL